MEIDEEQRIRRATKEFLERANHGRINELAELAGLSRHTITKIAYSMDPVQLSSLKHVRQALIELGKYSVARSGSPSLRVYEHNEGYVPAPPIEQLLAQKLIAVAGELAADYLTLTEKRDAILKFGEDFASSLKTYVAAFEKRIHEGN